MAAITGFKAYDYRGRIPSEGQLELLPGETPARTRQAKDKDKGKAGS